MQLIFSFALQRDSKMFNPLLAASRPINAHCQELKLTV